MSSCSYTSIVYNNNSKLMGLPPYNYRVRACDTNLTSNTPAAQYQIQKIIQRTTSCYASLYVANLAPLTAYRQPLLKFQGVCWNQMSDRPVPSVQKATIPSGFFNSLNRKHSSVTSSKPGSQTPGGIGCDIKHNSYDRYLNRLKGKGPMRRGVIPPTYGRPIKFNPAFPVYGGKTFKANIVTGCNCPIDDYGSGNAFKQEQKRVDETIFKNPSNYEYPSANCKFNVGNNVYAKQDGNNFYTKATVIAIDNGIYTIKFENETIQIVPNVGDLLIYYPCNCNVNEDKSLVSYGVLYKYIYNKRNTDCYIPSKLLNNISI